MTSTFTVKQSGKTERFPWKVINNASNAPMVMHSFVFYINNGTDYMVGGGGGISYGSYREGLESIYPGASFVITSANINGNTTGITYTVNISPYTYEHYKQGRVLEITVNSYT